MIFNDDLKIIRLVGHDDYPTSFTEADVTMFKFKTEANSLSGAMEYFAHLLKIPARRGSMSGAQHTLDSEVVSNAWYNGEEKLIAMLGQTGHPARRFPWINWDLENVENARLHQRAAEFKNRHYSAHRMSLCLGTHLSLDEMQVHKISEYTYLTPPESRL